MAAPDPPDEPPYDAFISYRRTDVAFARRLEKALNSYRPPRGLAVPQRTLKVFRDEGDLTGTEYYASIDRYLGQARKLIVVCTPAARASPYVDDEIRRFLRHRGAGDLVPVLLSGVPNNEATPDQAADPAFPEALCEALQMPLAVNYRNFDPAREKVDRGAFEGSWYTLLANLYDKGRDEIEQRDRVRRRRQRTLWSSLAAGVTVGFAALAAVAWWQKLAADEQRNVALRGLAKYLATASQELRGAQPQTALLLAVEAVRATRDADGSVTTAAQAALRGALAAAGGRSFGAATHAVVSADGTRLATFGGDRTARLWNLHDLQQAPQQADLGPGTPELSALSADGARLAVTTTSPAAAVLWRAGAAPQRIELPGARPLAFSADARWLAAAGDSAELQLWDLDAPHAGPRRLAGHVPRRDRDGVPQGVQWAAFDARGEVLLSGAADRSVRVWNLQDATSQALPGARPWERARLSADGRWIAQPGRGAALLWRRGADGSLQKASLEGAAQPSEEAQHEVVGFHPTLPLLVTLDGDTAAVWTLGNAAQRSRSLPARLAALSGDGNLLALVQRPEGGAGKTRVQVVRLDAPDREPVTVANLDGWVEQVAINSPGTQVLLRDRDGRLWQAPVDVEAAQAQAVTGLDGRAFGADYSADGRWLLAQSYVGETSMRLWPARNPSVDPVRIEAVEPEVEVSYRSSSGGGGLEPTGGLPGSLAVDPLGRWIALPGARPGTVLLVDAREPAVVAPRVLALDAECDAERCGPQRKVTAVAFDAAGSRLVAGAWNHGLRVWSLADPAAPAQRHELPAQDTGSSMSALALSPDGRWAATGGSSGDIVLWSLGEPAAAPRRLEGGHADWITRLQFSADGARLLSADAAGALREWSLDTPAAVPAALGTHDDAIVAAAYVAGGRIVSAGVDKRLDLHTPGAASRTLRKHADTLSGLALDAAGRWLVTGSHDRTVVLWDLQAEPPSGVTVGNVASGVEAVAISADARWIAAADAGGTLRLWDREAAPGTEAAVLRSAVAEYSGRRAGLRAIRFTPDGRWLVAAAGGQLAMWRLRLDEQLALACDVAGRNLTAADWQAHLERVPYRLSCERHGLHPKWLERADALARAGKPDEAQALYATARRVDPTLTLDPRARALELAAAAHLEEAYRLARSGEADAARAEFAQAAQFDPQHTPDAETTLRRIADARDLVAQGRASATQGATDAAADLFRRALALDTGLNLDPDSEARRPLAPGFERKGDELARAGRLDEAAAAYEQALAHGLRSDLEPLPHARALRAEVVAGEAREIARRGDLDAALQAYAQAQSLNPERDFDGESEARRGVAAFKAEQASRLALERRYPETLQALREARQLDAKVDLSSVSLNETCWTAVQNDLAAKVLELCELAVAERPEDGRVRDSRGVARALTQDASGAIEDFEAFVAWAAAESYDPAATAQRTRWIEHLRAGARVRTFAELEALGGQAP